jgi:hypothetical protein
MLLKIIRDVKNIMTSSYKIFLGESILDKIIWNFDTDNIELLAGMLAAGTGILEDFNQRDKTKNYYIDSDGDVSSFRIMANVQEDFIKNNSNGHLQEGEYGIWLKGSTKFHYSLYKFTSNYFFQGIISICNTFDVDFRYYIYGFPFDSYGNLHSLSGYTMATNRISRDVPDLDDIEEDEAYDENIIEVLARTDVIITLKD